MMGILRSMTGTVRAELTSADLPGAFGAISDAGIQLFQVEQAGELSALFSVSRLDFRQLQALCRKRGDSLRVRGRGGIYWTAKTLLRRPVLLAGILLFILLALYVPTRVFFVQVEGNVCVPTRLILAAAEQSGICFGASRREVRSERVKNALLEAVPELQWAGVNTFGCVAKISVRERTITQPPDTISGYGNIIAVRDGVITACTATEGNLLCAPGQVVTAGQILISGYFDCGICIRAVQAEGEVYAQTRRELTVRMPSDYYFRRDSNGEKKNYSLLIGKKRINLWKDSGIWDTTCGRMYREYYVTLPGGFQLPFALVVETFTSSETDVMTISQEEAEAVMTGFAANYLTQQMVAGRIRTSEVSLAQEPGYNTLAGEYVCIEMIGKIQRQQIGENNGESN